jgi:hypothetical protein
VSPLASRSRPCSASSAATSSLTGSGCAVMYLLTQGRHAAAHAMLVQDGTHGMHLGPWDCQPDLPVLVPLVEAPFVATAEHRVEALQQSLGAGWQCCGRSSVDSGRLGSACGSMIPWCIGTELYVCSVLSGLRHRKTVLLTCYFPNPNAASQASTRQLFDHWTQTI